LVWAPALETVKTNLVTSLKEGGVIELRGYCRFGLRMHRQFSESQNTTAMIDVAASLERQSERPRPFGLKNLNDAVSFYPQN
jgi:hypothetical protein